MQNDFHAHTHKDTAITILWENMEQYALKISPNMKHLSLCDGRDAQGY